MSVSKILISQATPANQAPYDALRQKYGVTIDFKPFFVIESLSSREFRAQKLNLSDYTAIVFTARHAIDAFFALCEELRVKVPDTMKYFCTTEAVAVYLQKHIIFRKRKIFYGTGTPQSVVALVTAKHKGEKFLITTAEGAHNEAITGLFAAAGLNYETGAFVKPVSQDLKDIDINSYDLAVVYNPADLKALQENFPDFKADKLKFVTFGKQIVNELESQGLPIAISAPTPEVPSVAKALEVYLSSL